MFPFSMLVYDTPDKPFIGIKNTNLDINNYVSQNSVSLVDDNQHIVIGPFRAIPPRPGAEKNDVLYPRAKGGAHFTRVFFSYGIRFHGITPFDIPRVSIPVSIAGRISEKIR